MHDPEASPHSFVPLTFIIFAALCVAWYFCYIEPRDKLLNGIMDCVEEKGLTNPSPATYTDCANQVRRAQRK